MSEVWTKWQDATEHLSLDEKIKGIAVLLQPDSKLLEGTQTKELLARLTSQSKEELAKEALRQLPESTQKSLLDKAVVPIPQASATIDKLWIIFVCVLSLAFFLATFALIYGMFSPTESKNYFTEVETVFTVWSTVTAYLAGLFSSGPTQSEKQKPT
jgi:hypothetical protein